MTANVGTVDRRLRFVFGPLLVVAGVGTLTGFVPLDWGVAATVFGGVIALVGVVFIATASVRWCPLNALFGIDTAHGTAQQSTGTDDGGAA